MVQSQFEKNMGITHSDFFRLLPKAMGEHSYTVTKAAGTASVHGEACAEVRVDVSGGTLTIQLGEQQERRSALMRIPFVIVGFTFNSVGDDQIEAFMQHFDLHFQRGGG